LCYNGESEIDIEFWPFKVTLFLEEGDDYLELCTSEDWIGMDEYDESNYCLDYNPKNMTWTKCHREGNKRMPVPGLRKLRLVLDGKQSHFVKL
jgi:hypothetical protein